MHEEIVRQVLALAQDSVAEPLRARLEGYIRAYVRAIPAEVLSEVEPKVLLAFLGERFAFLEEDFGRTVKVTIRDPQTTLADDQHSTVIETRLPDCAFVIRTIKAFLREQGLQLLFVLHPIHGVVAVDGKVTSVDAAAPGKYSQVYLQVTAIPPERREALRLDLERRLERTLLVNRDRFPMMARIDEVRAYCCNIAGLDASKPSPRESQQIPPRLVQRLRTGAAETPREREAGEVVELVDWFKDDNIILIGYAFFPASGPAAPQRGLGLFASDDHAVLDEVIGEIVATRRTREELYSFYHTDYRTVVRSVTQVQYFGIAEPGPDGRSIGEHVFVGLMSTKSAKQANRRIPVVGARVRQLMSTLEDAPGSYAYQKMAAILDSIPLEDLFYWTTDEVRTIAREFRLAESKDHPRVFVWRRPTGRRISVVCVVPRMQFSEALRAELSGEIRTFLQVPHLREYRQETDDESPIRLHFTVGKYRPNVSEADLEQLVDGLEHLLQSWTDQLRDLVFRRYRGDSTAGGYQATTAAAQDIWSRYGARFPQSYQDALPPEIALLDLGLIEQLSAARPVRVVLVRMGEGAGRYTSLRIVSRKELVLNDVVPSLHRMALRTTSRFAEKLEGPGPEVFVTSFEVSGADGKHIESEAALERLGQIVQRVLDGQLLDDRLLGLGYLAALDWQQIDLLITYRNYFVQVFQGFGAHSVNDALLKHPACAGLLVEYFETKFRTDRPESPQVRTEQLLPPIARRYDELLEDVTSIQEDLILRYFIDLFEATRRTNFYRPGRGDTISIKVESALIEHMPRPCPLYEVYVHAPGVEGIHLRGGKVARGGLRHSDRADDFRTEVLGLQRTQTLKNTVIVPTGSKGGFVTRKLGANREEARAQYEVFIAGLLDVTDNYQGTAIVPPPGVLRYDEDDPYLVVAADKGTAHLSDTANGISLRYGFWLDDAFASGGSAGYDHKAIGITSRGGWVNVERHFREMGTDIRQHSIRVAGVGDMSGDVFGNGMLLNDKMKVVAAFNHKHVFLDPEPDPATSYAERKRMFNTPGTQWTDYATSALSKGGGIYERAAKEIELSAEAQALLGLPAVVTGPDIVRAILQLDVDLMWFGGIGTYVKASSESHGEVGDKVNDNVRINASELRAKVLGEGANLAMTQRARTEYGQRGGRCNTDAIDNSAGVDCSDHEVNLKILFAPMMSTGQMTREARDKLLRELENDVATAVVQDNYLQSALLSMESTRTQQQGAPFLDLLQYLDKRHLNRAAEHVPPDEELRSWLATGKGLPRNLLAVLVAHTKLDLYDKVLASRIPDLALFKPMLFSYFPPRLAASHATWIERHHLRREIVATQATNAIINQAGSTLLVSLCKETVLPVDELVIRYFVCDELIGGRALRAAIHACDYQIPAAAQYEALLMIEDVLRVLLRWWIWNDRAWKVSSDDVDTLRPAFAAAGESLLASLDPAGRAALAAREQALLVKGFAPALAGQLARIGVLGQAFAVLHSARVHGLPLAEVAGMYQRVGRDLHLDTFDELLGAQVPANSWERRFLASIERESAAIRQLGVTKLASEVGYVERHRDRITAIADSLRMVRQFGGHGLVPMYLILEDYRVPW